MTNVTFVTACSNYHTDLLPLAIESVKRQTVPCEHVVIYDTLGQGAGWARNQGLAQVTTDFAVCLDSDDTVDPEFAAHTLAAFDGYHYVYTDFIDKGEVVNAPDVGHFIDGNNQVITALVPTIWLREVGGFDETMPGAEDTKLFLMLQAARHCGKRLAEPLFNYGTAGRRGAEFMRHPNKDNIMNSMSTLRGKAMENCCGENEDLPMPVAQPGDMLARAMWGGNRAVQGRATGRWYPRSGNGKVESVHPDDVRAAPNMWQPFQAANPPAPFVPSQPVFKVGQPINSVDEAARVFFGTSPDTRVMTAAELRAVQPAEVKPDIARVQALIAKAHEGPILHVDNEVLVYKGLEKPAPKAPTTRTRKGKGRK